MIKIIKRKSDNVVLYANDDLELTANGVTGTNFRAKRITTANAIIEEVASLPDDWCGLWYTYSNGGWAYAAYGIETKADLLSKKETEEALIKLEASDKTIGRLAEDLIETLINLNVIKESDLPLVAVDKINSRKALRGKL